MGLNALAALINARASRGSDSIRLHHSLGRSPAEAAANSWLMFLVFRRIRIRPVGIAVPDLAVRPMSNQLRFFSHRYRSASILGGGLSSMGGQDSPSLFDCPDVPALHDMDARCLTHATRLHDWQGQMTCDQRVRSEKSPLLRGGFGFSGRSGRGRESREIESERQGR